MARAKTHWMFSRPHRKLIRVPQTLATFANVAIGQEWNGSAELQKKFEDRLEAVGLKARGEHSERDRGRGGSGGRTHASMLYSLGLHFYWKEDADKPEEVHLTLAGQALVEQEDALPVLRRQVLAHQYPSAYSVSINIDRRFQLRPFVLLLRLLKDPDLNGYLTDAEIAACVITFGERHSVRHAEEIKRRVLAYRDRGVASLPADFADRFLDGKTSAIEQAVVRGKLGAVANTAVQWLRYTGIAFAASGQDFGSSAKTVTAINSEPVVLAEVEEALQEWGSKPLDVVYEPAGQYDRYRAAAAFQRTYGRKPGGVKDQRRIGQLRTVSEQTRITGQVTASLVHLHATDVLLEVSEDLVRAVVNHSGLPADTVRRTLEQLIATPQQGLNQFLDRYQQMAFSSQDQAIAFEKATASVMRDVFGLSAQQVGQGGRVPDIEVRADEWTGIVDTKAYAAYGLESDHQLRMQTSYVPLYRDRDCGAPLMFFMYIAGGFAPSFNANLRKVIRATGVDGSGIAIIPWLQLITRYPESGLRHEDLARLWSVGREITAEDIVELLNSAQAGSDRQAVSGRWRSDFAHVPKESGDFNLSDSDGADQWETTQRRLEI